jgi:HAD superfamily hydrolase (TIGR01549 family)
MVIDQGLTALLFDFDGTLFHLPVDYAAVRRELGQPADAPIGPLLQRFIDEGDEAGLAVVTRHECVAAAAGSFTAGALDCLRAPASLGIVTRNSRQAVLAALGELAHGIVIVGREDVRRLKPHPEGIRTALTRFGVDADRAALVGDTYHDVDAARAAGVRSIVVRNPRLEFAPPGADCYIDELTQVWTTWKRMYAC